MGALKCEICGGKLIGKPGGMFECECCGLGYSTAWAKEKIQEIKGTVKIEGTVEVAGKVQVEGGSVQVEGTATKESLLKRAKLCCEDGDWEKAEELIEQVLNADPECGEAYLYRAAIYYKKTLDDLIAYIVYHQEVLLDDTNMKKAYRFADDEVRAWKTEYQKAANADLAERRRVTPLLEEWRKKYAKAKTMIACSSYAVYGLKSDGTVMISTGKEASGNCNIVAIFCGGPGEIIGLKQDGTIIAAEETDIENICNIAQVSGEIVLKTDGTVVDTGTNSKYNFADWYDIIAISSGYKNVVGLKNDGTVVAVGDNEFGQCNVSDWRDIVAVSCGQSCTVGLKRDGTVLVTGDKYFKYKNWREIVEISSGDQQIVGIKLDGTVVADEYHYWTIKPDGGSDVGGWRDIIAVNCGSVRTAGLRSDGTVVVTKYTGDIYRSACDVSGWKLFDNFETIDEEREQYRIEAERKAEEARLEAKRKAEEERRIAEEKRKARIAELEAEEERLSAELANLKGLFSGRRKNEILDRLIAIDKELEKLR